MYGALFDAIGAEDIHLLVALITVPNDGSCALHEAFGFTRAMILPEAGRKFDRYWSVAFTFRPV